MSQPERFDALVLGTGQGGKLLAWHLARSGKRTAAVERQWIGGSCPNVACLPSKNELWSARVGYLTRQGARFGALTGRVATDMTMVRRRKRDMVEREIAVHLANFRSSGAELIRGTGRFSGPKTLDVALNDGGTRVLTADQVFINVGTRAAIPPVPGLEQARPLTHVEALELGYVPSDLIVLGGGYVGLELAQAFRRFGSRVTVVEQGPQLLGREDADLAGEIARILSGEGIRLLTAAEPVDVHGRSGEGIELTLRPASGGQRLEGSDLLVATGRIPNTAGIGLEAAGVALDERGYIRVNQRLETSAAGVWAIGECAGSPQFTHASVDDFRVIRDNLAGGSRSTRDRVIPYCMFTDPPLARVGLSEGEAASRGLTPRVARLPIGSVLRTEATDEKDGFMKALVGGDDRILGFSMIGAGADDVVAVVQMAMLAGAPYSMVRDAILAHPTMAEGLGLLLSNLPEGSARPAAAPAAGVAMR